ncbi:MAG: oligosaccharide flippase family protein, partial [Roseibium sp.]|nr:oligosaccharide flippase family protein [Roseibium sp.]
MSVFNRIAGRIDVRRLILTFVSRGLSTIFSFALIFSLARVLAAEEYGLYAMLFSIGSALGLVLTSGQATLIVKHFNREDPPGDNINRRLIT